ncbi:cation diffusion facilitator family transporter [Streptomyces sp. NBC_01186]|uniref:cation diffusion facilitator family transporter n=1 Tax=unclassified Streptomyces TaxID=2593676 RepID=UPI002DD8C392|nr:MULTISPECIES: cation diffusion facilitator family transporter [unclassified Streptomyces]WSB79032.1 cation diffusion facilitator family transporter [Streptomyces sp. NBC_01775]WSS12767.1 cation diffusion facilitator family transporter [Streptomyces sp. NBC_01186]
MGHAHGPDTQRSAGARHRRPLAIAFTITLVYMAAEVAGGVAFGSLALLSDAAHMGTDVLGLGMALAAITLANRPGPRRRTYGTYRLEVLAALANGVLLFGVAGYVLVEAALRWAAPPDVPGLPLLVVAGGGLVVNLVSFRLLSSGAKDSLNLKAAHLEVVGDLLGSFAVLAGAGVILATGWRYVDPVLGVAIGLFILPRAARVMGQAVRILLEAAPPDMDVADVEARIAALPGVAHVHDLHIWTLTSGMEAATGHVVLDGPARPTRVLEGVLALLEREYGITHATIQVEEQGQWRAEEDPEHPSH